MYIACVLFSCYKQIIACKNTKRRKRSLTTDDLYPALADQYVYVAEFYQLGRIVYGDPKWYVRLDDENQ